MCFARTCTLFIVLVNLKYLSSVNLKYLSSVRAMLLFLP